MMVLTAMIPQAGAETSGTIAPNNAGPYAANWESLDKRPTPDWHGDAKFGIFIHWGVYSVPSWAPVGQYAEWYWRHMVMGHKAAPDSTSTAVGTWKFHEKNYGFNYPYFDFAPMFRAELFNPEQWADIFLRSGAKYVVLTSKHHDGFCLWPSDQPSKAYGRPWNSVEVGPKRDLVGELTAAVRAKGMRMGLYYSLYEWFNPLWLTSKTDYATSYMHPQFKDVVTRYKPSIIFSDGEWEIPSDEWKSPELVAWLFNESPVKDEVVINDRWGKETRHKHGGYYTTEYGSGLSSSNHPWEESRGMAFSYGLNRQEALSDYRSSAELVLMLIDTVSRGGNLLLDIGPAADGMIPVIMEERLADMGAWLQVNGEAIFGTRGWGAGRQWSPGKIPSEKKGNYQTGYNISKLIKRQSEDAAVIEAFFTRKDDTLYVIVPEWPEKDLRIEKIKPAPGTKITLLGSNESIKWTPSEDGIVINCKDSMPKPSPTASPARVFKLEKALPRTN
jgi:alpha-L-fucosidase